MTGSLAVYALQLGCVGTGLALAWRRPEHRPLAALMALGLAVDVALELALPFPARVALGTCYPWAAWAVASEVLSCRVRLVATPTSSGRATVSGPALGASRGLRCSGAPSELRAQTGTYALASRLAIPLAFAVFVVAILASGVRGPALARCYAAAQFVVALGCARAVWRWRKDEGPDAGGSVEPYPGHLRQVVSLPVTQRDGAPASPSPTREPYAFRPLSATVACALVVAFVECAQPPAYLLLPSWTSGRAVYALGFVVVLVVQVGALRARRPPPSWPSPVQPPARR